MKVLGRILLERLEDWAEEHHILNDIQYGFRRGIGTVDQCLNHTLLIGKYTQAKRGNLYLCFLDLSNAFDCL